MNREEYVQKLKTQLDGWNAEAAKWESKAKAAQDAAKIEFEREIALFHQRREEGMQTMKEIQAASGEAWTEMQRGADDAWKRMREAFNQASSKFGK